MFETLSENLGSIFDRLTGRGVLSEKDVDTALQQIRKALLEADVALPVVRALLEQIRPLAIGADVLRSIKPGQQVIKIVHDVLIDELGDPAPLDLNAPAPIVFMLVGLQGSGKTTSTAKIAKMLATKEKRKPLLASLDTNRPAAMAQLQRLGEQAGLASLPIIEGQQPIDIAKRAIEAARLGDWDVVLLDTAGRGQADEALMAELTQIHKTAKPLETLLIADSLTGQEAVSIAQQFHARINLSGIMLTRIEGDGRGGAALSMRHVTGVPIKLLGTGEALDNIELFDPARLAGRILGQGDVTALVEKAAASIDAEKAEKIAAKMKKGQFDLDDLAAQLTQMRKMGGMAGLLGLLPGGLGGLGAGKRKKQFNNQLDKMGLDERALLHQTAIISSMTKQEKANPKLLNARRKRRIAAGSGTQVQDVNRLIKMHRQMADMMKKFGKDGMQSMLGGGLGTAGLGGGGVPSPMQPMPDFEQIQKQLGELPTGILPIKK